MEFLNQNMVSALILAVNLAATASYFIIHSNDDLKNHFLRLPVVLQKIYVLFFVAPLFVARFFQYPNLPILIYC